MPNAKRPWLKHYPAHVPHTMKGPVGPLPHLLEQASIHYPHREYLVFLGRSFTYAEMLQRAHAFAAALQGLGLPTGSRISICLPNSPGFVAAYWGTLLAGMTVVNINPLLTAEELNLQLRESGAAVLVTFNLQPAFHKLQQAALDIPHRWVYDLSADMPPVTALAFKLLRLRSRVRSLPPGWRWQHEVLTHFSQYQAPRRWPKAAVLQFTGGTTGVPKAAILTHASLRANTAQVQHWLGEPAATGETMIAVLPLFHIFALTAILHLGTAIGARIVLMPQFALKDLLKLIRAHHPTLLPGVPTLFNALATHPSAARVDMRSLRFCISGGAPLPVAVREAFIERTGAALVEGYGLTESSPVVACGPSVGTAPVGSVGYPLPGTEVAIRDAVTGRRKRPGEIGEIYVRGPQLMAGYWRKPAATRAVLKNGWLRTGDLGYLDESGALFLVDRIKDLINVNGYKVYPRQVEEVLATHPAVAEVLVLGVPHPVTGEAPKAFVTLKTGFTTSGAELCAWAIPKLNKMAKPCAVEIRESLPKTMVGKLSRKDLKLQLDAETAPRQVGRHERS